jgi:hypothetical protein
VFLVAAVPLGISSPAAADPFVKSIVPALHSLLRKNRLGRA